MRQSPIYLSASPHLSDHSANGHALDYTLGGKHTAAIFSIMFCAWCGKKYAVAPQPGMWVLFPYEGHGAWESNIGRVTGDWPVCIDPECVSNQGTAKILTVITLAAVVTKEGEWIDLGRRVEF